MLLKVVVGVIAIAIAVTFLAIPALKLLEIPMLVVMGIGIAMMIYELVETLRKDD